MRHPVAERVERDGWATLEGLFTPDECSAVAATCASRQWPRVSVELRTWISDPRWATVAVAVLGPEVRFVREQVVTKAPNTAAEVPWHQDSGYARIGGEFLTFFVALEEITRANGCLWMKTGSHRRGPRPHVPSGYLRTLAEPVDGDGEPVPLAPGGAVAFSSFTAHRSGGNRSEGTRPAWMVQFCAADALDLVTGEPVAGCPLVATGGTWLDHPRF